MVGTFFQTGVFPFVPSCPPRLFVCLRWLWGPLSPANVAARLRSCCAFSFSGWQRRLGGDQRKSVLGMSEGWGSCDADPPSTSGSDGEGEVEPSPGPAHGVQKDMKSKDEKRSKKAMRAKSDKEEMVTREAAESDGVLEVGV
jgi:hypothetical protein